MAETKSEAPAGVVTNEAFLATRKDFWSFFTRLTTYVATFLVLLLLFLWWWLV